jgi:hypothetical protein
MMGRVSGPAQVLVAIVLGVGGGIFYVQRDAAGPLSDVGAPCVEVEFRAMHATDSDDELRLERSRLHEAIAREIAVVADEHIARGEHTPGTGDASPNEWGVDELTVWLEADGSPVRVRLHRDDVPEVFRLHEKHGWITSILTARGASTE